MADVLEDANGNNEAVTANPLENQDAVEIVETGSGGSTETEETSGGASSPTVVAEPETDG